MNRIPISTPAITHEEEELVLEVLRSGRLAQGPMVTEFERLFSEISGTRHAVAVSNGTVALIAALQSLGVGPGDEVITSPFTFVASLNAILHVGARARFADIGDDYTVDPAAVAELTCDRTAAIMPVHLYGLPADVPAIRAAAPGIPIVEDAAQAHGASVGGRPVGSFGLGCFSFYATKNITTGEGGVVTTDDDGLADRLRLLRGQGMRAPYEYVIPGYNYRLTDIQAAIGIPQLKRIDDIVTSRQRNAARLSEGLRGLTGVRLPDVPDGRTHVFHQYTIEVLDGGRRDDIVAAIREAGIDVGVYYPRVVHDYDCYVGRPDVARDDTPRARQASSSVLSLPVHPLLSDSDLDRIVSTVSRVVG